MAKDKKRLALVTSDLHIDTHAWADRPTLSGDSRAAFAKICSIACKFSGQPESHPKFCIIAAGDLVERKRNDSSPANFIRRQMEILENGGEGYTLNKSVPFRYIQGQHDLQDVPWFNAVHRWPSHMPSDIGGNPWELGDYSMWGIDWTPPDRLDEELAKVPEGTDILVMHQVCDAFMGEKTSPELFLDRVPHARVLIIGDFHKRMKIRAKGAQGQDLLVLSPGSTNLREITEQRDKSAFILYDDLSVGLVRIPTRPVIEPPDILAEEYFEDLLEDLDLKIDKAISRVEGKVPEEILKPIIYMRYHRRLVGLEPRLCAAAAGRAHVFGKPIGEMEEGEAGGAEELELSGDLTLLGCLEEEVDPGEEPEVFQSLQRLLESDEPAAELAEMRKEYLDVAASD